MARRGIMAELQHQAKVAQREAEKRQRAAATAHSAAVRKAEQTAKAEERARVAAQRATEQERKRLEKAAATAHVAAMQAEAEVRTTELDEIYDEIDHLLRATLEVDDYVDLESLRQTVVHPALECADLEKPTPLPSTIPDPPTPTMPDIERPKGVLGRKKKAEQAQAQAQAQFNEAERVYAEQMRLLPGRREAAKQSYAAMEQRRAAALEDARARYADECAARESETAQANQELDTLIANLGYGTVDAVQEYVSIVLANSVYPDHFQVGHEAKFNPENAELNLQVLLPPPDVVPSTKLFKYVKAKDEIAETSLSQKACKDRYLGAVQAVTLRSLHEIFEADRRGLIRTIALTVGTNTIDPATGNPTHVLFAAVGAERGSFLDIDLSAVVPAATLEHLGAAISKNPYGLVAVKSTGVRKS